MTGTLTLIRLALRRDRVMLPAWIAVFVLTAASSASATIGLYPTVESRIAAAANANGTPALVALYGKIYDPTSLGALSMLKLSAFGAMLVAVLAMFTVVRHTRTEEETGRAELVGAAVVGRYAPLTAALVIAVGANLVLGIGTAIGLVAVGLSGSGALAFGLSWAAVGIVFAAVAAVAAQLTRSARAANGIATVVLGGAYLLRAVGDASGRDWLSWLSPIGWGQQMRPFAGDRWWVLVILTGSAAVIAAGAYFLVARRDMGGGVLPDRPGRAHAPLSLGSPLGLAWRLNRGMLLAWLGSFLVLGAVLGNIVSNIGGFLDSPQAQEMIRALGGVDSLTDAFLATEMGMLGVITTVYGMQVLMRMRTEETSARAEPVLASGINRFAWVGSHLVLAFGGVAILLGTGGLAAGLSLGAQTGDMGQTGRILAAAAVQLPAVWVVLAIVALLFGLVPRLITASWALLVGFLLLGEVGPLLKLPDSVMDLSPYAHVPRLPGGTVTAMPLLWLTLLAAGLLAAGLLGFRRRDIG